jgi:hypothetical protein
VRLGEAGTGMARLGDRSGLERYRSFGSGSLQMEVLWRGGVREGKTGLGMVCLGVDVWNATAPSGAVVSRWKYSGSVRRGETRGGQARCGMSGHGEATVSSFGTLPLLRER